MRMNPPPPPPPPAASPEGPPKYRTRPAHELGISFKAHLLRAQSGPLIVLTTTPQVHALVHLVPRPMNTIAYRDCVVVWDNLVVHT